VNRDEQSRIVTEIRSITKITRKWAQNVKTQSFTNLKKML